MVVFGCYSVGDSRIADRVGLGVVGAFGFGAGVRSFHTLKDFLCLLGIGRGVAVVEDV